MERLTIYANAENAEKIRQYSTVDRGELLATAINLDESANWFFNKHKHDRPYDITDYKAMLLALRNMAFSRLESEEITALEVLLDGCTAKELPDFRSVVLKKLAKEKAPIVGVEPKRLADKIASLSDTDLYIIQQFVQM